MTSLTSSEKVCAVMLMVPGKAGPPPVLGCDRLP